MVLEQVISTIGSVADTSEENFLAYCDRFMPHLKRIIKNATTSDLRLLRGRAIECVSLIGLAVGADKFTRDASEVMDMLPKGADMAYDDPQLSKTISAWARICTILGKQFQPYLPFVMETVEKAASKKPEVVHLSMDNLIRARADKNWQIIVTKGAYKAMNPYLLKPTTEACNMLLCCARELKGAFSVQRKL